MRAVVDTNVLVSGFFSGRHTEQGAGVLVASRTLVEEFGRTLRKPDLQTRLARTGITSAAAHAEMMVTGDKDLLVLGSCPDIPILKPVEAL